MFQFGNIIFKIMCLTGFFNIQILQILTLFRPAFRRALYCYIQFAGFIITDIALEVSIKILFAEFIRKRLLCIFRKQILLKVIRNRLLVYIFKFSNNCLVYGHVIDPPFWLLRLLSGKGH